MFTWSKGRYPFLMAAGNDHFRVCIVDSHDFLHEKVETVCLWFKITRRLLKLLRFDQVELRADSYIPHRQLRINPVPHEPDKVLAMFVAFPEPEGRRFVLPENYKRM